MASNCVFCHKTIDKLEKYSITDYKNNIYGKICEECYIKIFVNKDKI